jgi:hypothetical protein
VVLKSYISFSKFSIIDFNLQNLFDINQTKENSKLLFYIKWSDSISENEIIKQEQKIKTWLGIKLSDESFELIRFR